MALKKVIKEFIRLDTRETRREYMAFRRANKEHYAEYRTYKVKKRREAFAKK